MDVQSIENDNGDIPLLLLYPSHLIFQTSFSSFLPNLVVVDLLKSVVDVRSCRQLSVTRNKKSNWQYNSYSHRTRLLGGRGEEEEEEDRRTLHPSVLWRNDCRWTIRSMYNYMHMRGEGERERKSNKFHRSFTQLEKVSTTLVMLNFICHRANDKQSMPEKSSTRRTIFPRGTFSLLPMC